MRLFHMIGLTLALLPARAAAQDLLLHMLDVGYGSCMVLQAVGSKKPWTVLIDAGNEEALPAIRSDLRRFGIVRIDAAFLTHPHPNHAGGLRAWRRPAIGALYWSGDAAGQSDIAPTLDRLRRRGVDVQTVRKGWRLAGPAGIAVEALNPASLDGSIHENDVVLWVTFGKTAMLLSGDLDPRIQETIMQEALKRARADGLDLCFATWPHHGDRLDPAWAEGIPDTAWIGVSVGPNSYGLPRVEDYPALAPRVLRTDRLKSFTIRSDGQRCHQAK